MSTTSGPNVPLRIGKSYVVPAIETDASGGCAILGSAFHGGTLCNAIKFAAWSSWSYQASILP